MPLTSKKLNLMFIGAAKRLSLLERFQDAAAAEGVDIKMYSVEFNRRVPIADVAEIIEGPSFKDAQSEQFLVDVARNLEIDIVIPNIDPATVVLSKVKSQLLESGTWAVISDHDLCVAMFDKGLADSWFRTRELPLPDNDGYPRIVKVRTGSGAKGQFIVNSEDELSILISNKNIADYIFQAYVSGQEYTVDAYVSRSGSLLGCLSRKRIVVSDGEVEVSETFRHDEILHLSERILAIPGWEGPMTLQFIDGPQGPVLIEINPRFGGGVTHAIHCGLDMPRWILRESMNLPLDPAAQWPDGSYMTRCRRDIFL
jgi:carbamoyl-phosphate synthase large subunit